MHTTHQKIIDISPLISEKLAVFPGDQSFSLKRTLSFEEGHNLTLGQVHSTLHLGAHTDAPLHYHKDGESMESIDLSIYMGPCQVIEVSTPKGERICLGDLKEVEIAAPRILFKTDSFNDPNRWNEDFTSISPKVVNYLASKKVILIGIDTPSVDPQKDSEILSHKAIYKNQIAILEGIILKHVQEGLYNLIALPLKLKDADASPVRAILQPLLTI